MSVANSLWYHYFSLLTWSFCFLLILSLLSYNVVYIPDKWKILNNRKSELNSSIQKAIKFSWILTILACSAFLLTTFFGAVSKLSVIVNFVQFKSICKFSAIGGTIGYSTGKCK